MKRAGLLFPVLALALVLARERVSTQSLSYSSGQDTSPAFEGFEKNDDGSFNLVFGYMNRNWEEETDVPIGPDNNISPGPADQGQPTHLLPRRNRFMFRVRVPRDFGDKELVWTLTTHGRTNKAYASLRPDYIIDDVVIASETGALGAGSSSPEMRANKAPVTQIEGPKTRTAKVGQPLQIVNSDDTLHNVHGLAKTNKEFIKGLFPEGVIYASLLPEDAQSVIGKTGAKGGGFDLSPYASNGNNPAATGAIVGVGSAERMSAVRWNVARRVVWAWVLTIPGSAAVAMLCYWLVALFN